MSTRPTHPFNNEATQTERKEVLENDRLANTCLGHTHDDLGGRFAKPRIVVGADPIPNYLGGPDWAPDPTGIEPPLNYSVNAMEPTGEPSCLTP